MSDDPHALKIYIDGNAYGNPGGAGGFAGIAEFPEGLNRGSEIIFQEGYQKTTNNRMEVKACLRAFEYLRDHAKELDVQRAQVFSDSQYACIGLKHMDRWRQNKWRTLDGPPVENVDLWKDLLRVRSSLKIRVDVVWKKGKKTRALKAIDDAAKAAGKQPWKDDRGFREGKVGRSMVKEEKRSASVLYSASGQDVVIRIYKTVLAGKTKENKVFFSLWDETERKFGSKYRAYTTPETGSQLHRFHIYRALQQYSEVPADNACS